MGILQSKKRKQKGKHPFNKDVKNGAAKEAATKDASDFNHGEANALTGNLDNTANTSPGQGPTQLISHQMEPSNGNEAILTRMYQVPAFDAPQNREQNLHKAVNISQHADPVKYIPYPASAVRVTQQHTYPAKPKDKKTSTPKPMLQQATPARPTAGSCCGVKTTAGEFDALSPDILKQLQNVPEKLSQQQSKSSAQVPQKTKQKITIAPAQQQANRQVMDGHTQHEESRNLTPSQKRPAAKETSFGSKEQQEMTPQLPTAKLQAPVRRACREVVRGVTTENLHSKEAEAQMKAKINKSPSQKSKCKNKASTDLICHATDKAHHIAEQSTTTKPGTAEVPSAKPTKPPNHSAQVSNQSKAHVNNEENALQEHCLNHNGGTNMIAVDYLYCFRVKSEISRTNAAKMRLRHKLAKKLKAQPGDDHKGFQPIAEETVTTVQESSQHQGCTAMEENTIEKPNEPHHIPQPNKADNETSGNTTSCMQKVNVKALAPQVPVVEGMPTTVPSNTAIHNPESVKLRLQRELNETGIIPAVPPEPKIRAEGRWQPFTVYQSCPHKVGCQHNSRTGLQQNVQKRSDEYPNYLCEPPWVTTARFAACLALIETQKEEGDSHQ
ncbi:uncharacterized protein LOC122878649 [Siniperca chuatsi]|uniref:uncharacterized protein LOC122878649 n=1 Tax=Siniperca chuatsi TaxID=119488 RepID=UPI001CE1A570|nr:uncharacterized protein LOC122878649 [Siniperca chuatsi]